MEALHLICILFVWGHTEMVNFLLAKGADPNKAGAPWAKPIEWAKKKNHSEIEKVLKESGAK